jgi:hypothetical protein
VRPGGSWGDVHTLTKRNSCIIDRKAFLSIHRLPSEGDGYFKEGFVPLEEAGIV